MRDVEERGAVPHDLFDPPEALLLEVGVADRQHLVDQQDVGLQEGGNGETQPHLHAEGEELDLTVDGVVEPGELARSRRIVRAEILRRMPSTAP